GREDRDVGQRAVGLDPGVVGLDGPGDRGDGEEAEREEQAGRGGAVETTAGGRGERGGGDDEPRADEQAELDLRRAPQQQADLRRADERAERPALLVGELDRLPAFLGRLRDGGALGRRGALEGVVRRRRRRFEAPELAARAATAAALAAARAAERRAPDDVAA